MIAFLCPTCHTALNRDDREAGTKIACPSCGQRLLIPDLPPPPTPPQPVPKTVLGLLQPAANNRTVLGVLRPDQQASGLAQVGAGGLPASQDQQAILNILREDHRLAESTMGAAGENSSPSQVAAAIQAFNQQAQQLNLAACPADFRVAYRQYLRALVEVQQAFAQIPDGWFAGFLAQLLDMFNNDPHRLQRLQGDLKSAQGKVLACWEEVERIGVKYGAAL
ncbi:MAG: hypothetical protein JNM56_10295 [Planctomycetia bacterium]|nr:hypothetical protein [Planctomycetia bacterium]